MREIKFRAWDRRLKTFIQMVFYKEEGKFGCCTNKLSYDKDRDYPQQFTGLKDKNGKELYEGDIVKVTEKPVQSIEKVFNNIYKVQFSCGEFECLRLDSGLVYLERLGTLCSYDCLEVIGNVYENQDLLKEPKETGGDNEIN